MTVSISGTTGIDTIADNTVTAAKIASGAVDLTSSDVTGVLPQANGGTGSTSLSSGLPGFSTVLFTSSGSWSVPSGVTRARVTVIGGGGAGANFGGQNGGYGGVAIAYVTGISGTITITVGAGGTSNGSGGTSSFGSYVSATGGAGASSTNGIGTVTTGTALRTGNASQGSFIFPSGGSSNTSQQSAYPYTTSSTLQPGSNGNQFGSGTGYAGVGGIVLIEY